LLLTDQPVEVKNFKKTLITVLERFKPETDLFIFANLSLDTLDYTGPELNKGSRGVMLGIGEKVRDLPKVYQGTLPQAVTKAIPFCPGCLVLEVPEFQRFNDFSSITHHEDFAKWPLIVLVDNASKATKDEASFLWTTFTRFEPAADIHANTSNVFRHHLCYSGPIVIDARMKPTYPQEVLCDDTTASLVTQNWQRYFPQGMEMGDSFTGHVI
jgi:3-polyprenyl-4-hydroxybenzoate decarboxylase